ncbi:5'-methylthioadenosine/S-adenosylhomocysteine nucleosidase [Aureimonas leprariae]|uniref:phosphorylase family protein n=1 Tax=Plantimonas leprariae TaxID=2615207 RepID=UPI001386BD3D|nr:5'-methylthioadenosine/S-adenosylhomocysteine nucleosidase [Aureimonas leprariae]
MTKPYFDIGLIVPLREELEALTSTFPVSSEKVDNGRYFAEIVLPDPDIKAVAVLQDDMGKSAATRAADCLLEQYDLGIIIIIGIAGGISGDVGLGDVVFSGVIADVLDNAKITDKSKRGMSIELSSQFYSTDRLLEFAIEYISIAKSVRSSFEEWQLAQLYKAETAIPGEFIGRSNKNEKVNLPRIHGGAIVCGAVSKSEIYKSTLKQIDRKLLAVETESGGVFRSAEDAHVPAITIRGICDFSDNNKNKLEEQTNSNGRKVAADNAVSFFKLQFSNPQFLLYLRQRRQTALALSDMHNAAEDDSTLVTRLLNSARKEIHERLTELSPDYRSKPIGYRLPLPRIKPAASNATASPLLHEQQPIDILESIVRNQLTVVNVPKSYPDNALPWIIAGELLLIEIDGKQAIPLHIDGGSIRPPNGTFARVANIDLSKLYLREDARPVIVITDFEALSPTRVAFLREQIDAFPEARVVMINRDSGDVAQNTEMVSTGGALCYDVCAISFIQISEFFRRTFQLAEQEATVIALRLSEMFRKFSLNAHPSYFSNVASEVIGSLLRANRRAELLQIAVSAFLSFIVANDKTPVVLSRTTRETFLRKLAFEKKVNLRNFTRTQLIAFVEEFAGEKDFEIDPIKFISSFQDRGIIHFENKHVQISLPFIESYLLSSELVNRPDDAKRYFDLSNTNFDFVSFDIYSEIGPSDAIVDSILTKLKGMVENLAAKQTSEHILLTNTLRPALLEKTTRLKALDKRIQDAYEDVNSGRSNSLEKQRLLDLATRVEGSARDAQNEIRREHSSEETTAYSRAHDEFRLWGISTTLLGSASERLNKEPKRSLAKYIVAAMSLLLDQHLRAFPAVEFQRFKTQFQSEKVIREIFDVPDADTVDEGLKDFVSVVVDAYEFSLLGSPIRSMFGQLGNVAAHTVLRTSISSIETGGKFEELIAKVWAAEIEAVEVKNELIKAIDSLPIAPFLRVTLSTYFMTRVYWTQWEKQKRFALLDAAEATIKPLNRSFDKGQLRRMILREDDSADRIRKE